MAAEKFKTLIDLMNELNAREIHFTIYDDTVKLTIINPPEESSHLITHTMIEQILDEKHLIESIKNYRQSQL